MREPASVPELKKKQGPQDLIKSRARDEKLASLRQFHLCL